MLTLERAKELNATMVTEESLVIHATNVMAAMGAMAEHFGENVEHWQAIGFLHDYDYEQHPEEHLQHTREPLLAAGADSTARNKNGSTPLNWVRTREASECRTLLKADMRARGLDVPDGPTMTLDELRQKLNREAVLFRSKAAQGEAAGTQSWLGRVTWQHPGEERPVDAEGTPLESLATIFVRDLPYVPAPLRKLELMLVTSSKQSLVK